MLGGSRSNLVCECAIVSLRTTFYNVMFDINMTIFGTPPLMGGVNSAWLMVGSRIFQGITQSFGVAR